MRIKNIRPKYQRRYAVARWTIFFALMLISFVFSGVGSFVKPLFLIPLAICISINEDEITSACVGLVGGLLIDLSCDRLFGYNAVILLCSCVFTSLIFVHLLRRNSANAFIITSATAFIQGGLDYLLYYVIFSSEDVSSIYSGIIFPSCVMTSVSAFAIYPLIRAIRYRFTPERLQASIDL